MQLEQVVCTVSARPDAVTNVDESEGPKFTPTIANDEYRFAPEGC